MSKAFYTEQHASHNEIQRNSTNIERLSPYILQSKTSKKRTIETVYDMIWYDIDLFAHGTAIILIKAE